MVARHAAGAVEAIASEIESEIAGVLTALETEADLDTGTLAPPVAVLRSPNHLDTRSPVVLVWDDGSSTDSVAHFRNGLRRTTVFLGISFLGTVNLDANALKARLYAEALATVVRSNPTIDGSILGVHSVEISPDLGGAIGPNSAIRELRAVECEVLTWKE